MNTAPDLQTILVVDDTPANIDVLIGILSGKYKVLAALSGQRALQLAHSERRPDLILLDVMMPEMDGYSVLRALKTHPLSSNIPVIFVTALSEDADEQKGLELGAVDYITKPITSSAIVLARIRTHLALHQQNLELSRKVNLQTQELIETRHEIIRRLGRAAEFRDNETGLHVIRMSHYARIIAKALGIDDGWSDLLLYSAPMHDIGKIGIPDGVLLKQGRLTDEEWRIMKRHPEIGAMIIGDQPNPLMQMAREIALCHHEKWDGSGYPQGLKGEAIPLSARIATLADVFDALTTARPYKDAWSAQESLAFLQENAGSHFDPDLVKVFMGQLDRVFAIRDKYHEDVAPVAEGKEVAR